MTNQKAVHGASAARRMAGFTLVEILIVVVILGILATVVVPQFSNASAQARENTLKDELRYLRTQIVVFKAQHRDIAPGVMAPFADQMILFTDELGNTNATATPVFKYGPYLSKMPKNTLNQLDTLEITSDSPPIGDGSHGWEYNEVTQEIIADLDTVDPAGVRHDTY
jgi:general secretion pathway protein G